MSALQPLGLLDLPKELRLMVFEYLPIRVTHDRWEADADCNGAHADITLVWTTLPGVQILATCRAMHEEAGSILHPRLEAMKNAAIRLVISPDWMASIEYSILIDYLEPSNFKRQFGIDTRGILSSPQHGSTREPGDGSSPNGTGHKEKRVEIALRSPVGSGTSLKKMLVDLEERLWSHAVSGVETKGRTLLLFLRAAPRTATEQETYQEIHPLDLLGDMNAMSCAEKPEVQLWTGNDIEPTDWEQDWAEGERSTNWLFENAKERTFGNW